MSVGAPGVGFAAVGIVFDHPQSCPKLEIQLEAFCIFFHQPSRRLFPGHMMHGDVLISDPAAFADFGQLRRTHEGDALVAHARTGRADQQHVDLAGSPTGFLFKLPHCGRFQGVGGVIVTFEPGARTAWHTHPLGQSLVVLSGLGRVQREGGPVEEIRPGDVVWFAPGEKHWHGASPSTAMTHIAIQEALDGKVVDWMEHVSDEEYAGTLRVAAPKP